MPEARVGVEPATWVSSETIYDMKDFQFSVLKDAVRSELTAAERQHVRFIRFPDGSVAVVVNVEGQYGLLMMVKSLWDSALITYGFMYT